MKSLQIAIVLVLFVACAGISRAATILGTEDPSTGFIGNISFSSVQVGSDAEFPFHPFNIVPDVSDAISFDNQGHNWTQAAGGSWLQVAGTTTFYLIEEIPQDIGPGDLLGVFHSPDLWVDSILGTYLILEPDGSVSDEINLFNDANGAVLTFQSGPGVAAPAPSTAMSGLLLLAAVGSARLMRRRLA
jgi:hypothetical protein